MNVFVLILLVWVAGSEVEPQTDTHVFLTGEECIEAKAIMIRNMENKREEIDAFNTSIRGSCEKRAIKTFTRVSL